MWTEWKHQLTMGIWIVERGKIKIVTQKDKNNKEKKGRKGKKKTIKEIRDSGKQIRERKIIKI